MEKRRSFLYSLIASLAVTVLIGAGVLKRVDKWAQDSLFQKPGVTSGDIVIIGIDEEALEELGPYQTWDRNVIASALEVLAADPSKKPAVTAVDILYVGHTSEQADLRLAAAAQDLGNVITATMAEFGEQVTWVDGHAALVNTSAVVGYLQPYKELRDCTEQGHINAMSDTDGVMRHGVLYVEPGQFAGTESSSEAEDPAEQENSRVYSMSYKAAQIYLRSKGQAEAAAGAETPQETAAGVSSGAEMTQEAADGSVSTDKLFYIPYTGRPGDFYDGVSIARLIRGEVPADYWAGRIVLIGPYAAALQDSYFTPIDKGEQMFGVEIQANMIQSYLENNAKREIPDTPQLIVLFLLCVAVIAVTVRMEVLPGSLACGALAAYGVVVAVDLYQWGYVTHVLWIPAGVGVMYILAMAVHYLRAVRERQALALEKERTGAELSLANRIQVSALPTELPHRPEFEIFGSMIPAKKVGGDSMISS